MDILRVLSSTDLEVRKKTLDLVMELVTLRNIEEVSIRLFVFTSTKFTMFFFYYKAYNSYYILMLYAMTKSKSPANS